ncbi:hypothetical protein [Streptomyces sp. TS71-3]|uniref:hypothetical protein n=1 Tax=Streptomyces sp. TS71-3 TaxID=2733862 RepID=UPI001B2B4F6E|nr:hypothetical protein [Streptomyces sp. TS71-3]GHJ36793.1 hypothetical protein Sm713_24020 [Streptomyces sp. TS71-3]
MTEHRTSGLTALRRSLVVLAAALFTLPAIAGTAGAASGSGAGFAAQAQRLGLSNSEATALQSRADRYLDEMGGTQVGVNKIRLGSGAEVVMALPGEKYARDLDAASSPAGTQGAAYVCNYGHMCAYQLMYETGDVIDMYTCKDYVIPWVGTGSWDNNQTTGTVAYFKDNNGTIGWSSPGARSWDEDAPWDWVHWVNNCR